MRPKCQTCKQYSTILFDCRYLHTKIEIYVIKEDGVDPVPSGFCLACFKKELDRDLNTLYNNISVP